MIINDNKDCHMRVSLEVVAACEQQNYALKYLQKISRLMLFVIVFLW